VIGVGASASVYEAEDVAAASGPLRRVALKILHPHLAGVPAVREAFLREAARARDLRHPNIVGVLDCGLQDAGGVELAWIALDLVEGISLAEWVAQRGRMTVPEAVAVATGTLAALGEAHRLGIVHRDVNPRNIMLASAPPDEPVAAHQVRVLDFGLADTVGGTTLGGDVLLADGRTTAASVVGSVHYMSPEQAQGLPIRSAGDLYQVGAVLYFLVTGQPPYPRDKLENVLAAQVSAPPPVPSALVPSARPLDRVVTRAMAKDPARRPVDTYAFAEALRGALSSLALAGNGYQPTLVMAAAPARPATTGDGGSRTTRPPATGTEWPGTAPAPATSAGARPPLPSAGPARSPATGIAITGIAIVAVLAVGSAVASSPTTAALPPSASPSASATVTPTPAPSPSPSPSSPALVTVPPLSGTLADARAELKKLGLRVGPITRVLSPEAADQVLEQSPDAGLQVAWGTRVRVKVASGSNLVPNVADLPYGDAVSALRAAGFACTDTELPSATIAGTVPAAGVEVAVGSIVSLSWSAPTSGPTLPASGTPDPSPSPSASGG
jgi:serine/threonine-protein kinase